jgi:hypothetical protein
VAEARFEQAVDLRASPEVVHAFLLDLHHHRDLHPLIERIEDLPPAPERPAARRYRVIDRFRFGPVSFRTAYVTELEDVSTSEIRGRAWQSPGIEVATHYAIAPAPGGGTRLREECVLSAPSLMVGFVRRQAEAAHRATFAKLDDAIGPRRGGA